MTMKPKNEYKMMYWRKNTEKEIIYIHILNYIWKNNKNYKYTKKTYVVSFIRSLSTICGHFVREEQNRAEQKKLFS